MTHKRLQTWQKATALVPLALLSGAWTTSLVATSSASAAPEHARRLPDGTTVPQQPVQVPASVSQPGALAPGVPAGAEESVISSSSADGIPAAALAAYQRAATVIDQADPGCHLRWQLVAAIGRVESDHGRYGGNVLGEDGRSRPGIYGIPLDGSNGTARIDDTDAGQYDQDPVYDRAVGPMQFIPSTWAVVGVDGDADGKRDPQDIDDAALATSVYLCSGPENLSTTAGQRQAVYRYNHSQDYVDLVLSIMGAYLRGEYDPVPTRVAAPTVLSPATDARPGAQGAAGGRRHHPKGHAGSGATGSGGGGGTGGSTGSTGGTAGTGGSGTPSVPGTGTATSPSDPVTQLPGTVKDATSKLQEATAYCTDQLAGSGASDAQLQSCVDAYVNGGKAAADTVIAGILDLLGGVVGGVGGILTP